MSTGTDINQADLQDCPFCAEKILAKAKKCKHCGETIDAALRKAEEALRIASSTPNVFMNAGGASSSSSSAAAAASGGGQNLRPYGHGIHIILSILTAGVWIPVWAVMYLFRNKSVYY